MSEEKKTSETETDEFFQKMREEVMGIKRLNAIESDELFDKQITKRKYVVSDIMPEGLLLLFGEPVNVKFELCSDVLEDLLLPAFHIFSSKEIVTAPSLKLRKRSK